MERACRGFTLHYGPEPEKDAIARDDEEHLLRELSDENVDQTPEKNESGDSKPKQADWRYGPAQVWYELFLDNVVYIR